MRRLFPIGMIALVGSGCGRGTSKETRPDPAAASITVAADDAAAAETSPETEPLDAQIETPSPELAARSIPTRTHTRMRVASEALNVADHGIDGSFELWRDVRLDDATMMKYFFTGIFSVADPEKLDPPFTNAAPESAQLVLRASTGKIIESLDLGVPIARLSAVRLGDDAVPYLAVDIDTYGGAGRWGGRTIRHARIEGGHTHWLGCDVHKCALGCDYGYEKRSSGGHDILTVRHWYAGEAAMDPITIYERIEIDKGRCVGDSRTVPTWVGSSGAVEWPASSSAFPPRSIAP